MKRRLAMGVWLVVCLLGATVLASGATSPNATDLALNSAKHSFVDNVSSLAWWKVVATEPGAVVFFLDSPDAATYPVRFELYSSDLALLVPQDQNFLGSFKTYFGYLAQGTYYLKVETGYADAKKVEYDVGVAFATKERVFANQTDSYAFNIDIAGGTKTWLLLLDTSDPIEAFNPNIEVYYDGKIVGESVSVSNLDYISWDIAKSYTFQIKIMPYQGAGKYYVMIVKE